MPRAATTASAGRPRRPSTPAREQVARLIGAKAKDIIFTSGATESDNLAVQRRRRVLPGQGQPRHHAGDRAQGHPRHLRALERKGLATVTYLPVDQYGRVDPDDVRKAITDKTVLVSIMFANNEIGTVQPLAEIGKITRETRRAVPQRRGAGRRQAADRRRGDEHRSAVADGAQDLRTEGHRRALRALEGPARPPDAASSTAAVTSAACGPAR